MGFFSSIIAALNPLETITTQIAEVMKKREDAKSNKERMEYDAQLETLREKRASLAKDGSDPLDRLVRSLFACIALLYLMKLIVFDKVFGAWLQWSTDPLSPWEAAIIMEIIAFYFLFRIVGGRR